MQTFVELFAGVLAVVALLGATFVVVVRIAAPQSGAARFASALTDQRVALSAVIGVVATLGSLYFSEIAHMEPCRLCWFQRTMMYPIAVIGVVAVWRRATDNRWYFVALAGIGLLISAYHNLIELVPSLGSDSCNAFGPACSIVWFRSFGVLSLATMALCGFVAVVVLNTVTFPGSTTTAAATTMTSAETTQHPSMNDPSTKDDQ